MFADLTLTGIKQAGSLHAHLTVNYFHNDKPITFIFVYNFPHVIWYVNDESFIIYLLDYLCAICFLFELPLFMCI